MKIIIRGFVILLFLGILSVETTSAQSKHKADSLVNILTVAKHDTVKIKLLLEIGDIYKKYIPDTALYYYNIALIKATNIKKNKFIASALRCIGAIYSYQGVFGKAMDYFMKSLKIFNEIEDKEGVSQCYNNIGIAYTDQGIYNKAIEYFMKSLKIMESLSNKSGITNCYNNIGNVYSNMAVYDKAKEYYLKSVKIYEEIGDKRGMPVCYSNIGSIYALQGNSKTAIEYFIKSLKIYTELDNKKGLSSCYSNIGNVNSIEGNYLKAKEYYYKALGLNEEIKDRNGTVINLGNLANVFIQLKDYNKAIDYAQEGVKIAKEAGILILQKDDYEYLYTAYDSLGNYKKAYEYLQLCKQINDSIFNQENSRQIADMQTKYETEKKETEILLKENELQIQNLKINKMYLYIFILIALVILFMLSLCVAYFILRKNKLKTMLNTIKLEQKLLISQINPHFIFNLLNVIQNIIFQNKKEFAIKHLTQFAKLIRTILETSRQEYITLDKEINMLGLYMELQMLRFKNKFNYVIETSTELSPEMITIPPMLAQPIIENAIEHGIMHKEGTGNIKIVFKAENEMLLFEVIDDGIGREKSKELQNQTGKKHVSLATTITQERIENINKSLRKEKKKIEFNIFDLKDECGNPLGTKVVFHIPCITK